MPFTAPAKLATAPAEPHAALAELWHQQPATRGRANIKMSALLHGIAICSEKCNSTEEWRRF